MDAERIEVGSLVFMGLFFLLGWLPGSIAKKKTFGNAWLMSNREGRNPIELKGWGGRVERAYINLQSNLISFAISVLLLLMLHHYDHRIAWACLVFCAARVVHYAAYGFGFVMLRSLAYFAGLIATLYLFARVLC